jgi:DNA-binding transcriptional ArsR family regulator
MRTDPDLIWKALADPTRRSILDMLRFGPLTTGDLADQFDQSRFGVMKHLDVLHECGLLSVERRGRERWNYLNAARLKEEVDRWLTPFQTQWANRLNHLREHMEEASRVPEKVRSPRPQVRQETELPAAVDRVFV